MTTAAEIARNTVRDATPDAPPLIREITRAVFDGQRRIRAEVVLFDGLPAKLRLERWAHGWGFGWDEMPGGSCSLEGNEWRRAQEETPEYDEPDDPWDCYQCGGEGFVWSCFDGFCVDAEEGCDDCTRPCPECARRKRDDQQAPVGQTLGDVLSDALSATSSQDQGEKK